PAPLSIRADRSGKSVDHKSASGSQAFMAARERSSANRVHDHFDPVGRKLTNGLDEIGLFVVDGMIDSQFPQVLLLGGSCRAKNDQTASPCKLHRGYSHAPSRPVDE